MTSPDPEPGSRARAGYLRTPHGNIEVPGFLPVATRGAVRLLDWGDVYSLGFDAILANAYHLMLRPGVDYIAVAGGLHSFLGWNRPILTDSGGFQAMSLGGIATDEGIIFRSVYDGTRHLLTPEEALRVQAALGVDIAVALDECPRLPAPIEQVRAATYRSLGWARRSIEAFWASQVRTGQLLAGVVQGGVDEKLRREAAVSMVDMGFDVYAIGGLSVGEEFGERLSMLDIVTRLLPSDRPRYLMGVGDPPTILEAIWMGVDLFDSVLPTRLGRHGTAMTWEGRVNLRASSSARQDIPISQGCGCPTCLSHTRGYIRHLLLVGEETGRRLVSLHNLYFTRSLFKKVRKAIESGTLEAMKEKILTYWGEGR
ncbi:MAG: tRNA guanosine(34) transglycosylase Tgt [Acidimicrobiia bacterium]